MDEPFDEVDRSRSGSRWRIWHFLALVLAAAFVSSLMRILGSDSNATVMAMVLGIAYVTMMVGTWRIGRGLKAWNARIPRLERHQRGRVRALIFLGYLAIVPVMFVLFVTALFVAAATVRLAAGL
jgi:hypothetical protein